MCYNSLDIIEVLCVVPCHNIKYIYIYVPCWTSQIKDILHGHIYESRFLSIPCGFKSWITTKYTRLQFNHWCTSVLIWYDHHFRCIEGNLNFHKLLHEMVLRNYLQQKYWFPMWSYTSLPCTNSAWNTRLSGPSAPVVRSSSAHW